MLPAFTAMTFVTVFATEEPFVFRHDPERVAAVAIAAERAQSTLMATWHRQPRMLGAELSVAILRESHLDERVHSGDRRGAVGETCLMQVLPSNQRWDQWSDSLEGIVGTEIGPTTACLLTGLSTLIDADRACSSRYPRRNWLRMTWAAYASGSCVGASDISRSREKLTNRIAWTNWQPTESHRQALAWAMMSEKVATEQ